MVTPFLFLAFGCTQPSMQGCPAGVVELGADETWEDFPSAREFLQTFDGVEITDMAAMPDATVTVDLDEAAATVVVERSRCANASGDRITYLAPAVVQTDDGEYAAELFYRGFEPAPAVGFSDQVPGPFTAAWIDEVVRAEFPDAGQLTAFSTGWSLPGDRMRIGARYEDEAGAWTEYDASLVPELELDYTVQIQ